MDLTAHTSATAELAVPGPEPRSKTLPGRNPAHLSCGRCKACRTAAYVAGYPDRNVCQCIHLVPDRGYRRATHPIVIGEQLGAVAQVGAAHSLGRPPDGSLFNRQLLCLMILVVNTGLPSRSSTSKPRSRSVTQMRSSAPVYRCPPESISGIPARLYILEVGVFPDESSGT